MTCVQLYRLVRLVQTVHVAQLIVNETEAQRRLPDISSAQQARSLGAHELVHFRCIDACLAPYPLCACLVFFSEFVFLKLALKMLRSVISSKKCKRAGGCTYSLHECDELLIVLWLFLPAKI